MKKTVIILVLLAYCLTFGVPAFAKTAIPDAFDVDAETRALLGASEEDTVFQVYGGYFLYGFAIERSLDETFADGWSLSRTFYVIASQDETGETAISSKYLEDGEVKDTAGTYYSEFYELSNQNDRILGVLGRFVKANKIIYMSGLDTLIYYETNIGDYIYYTGNLKLPNEDAVEFLVPLKEFGALARAVMRTRGTTGVSGPDRWAEWVADWAPYNLSHYTYRPPLLILCWVLPVLLLAGGGVWLALRHRKKSCTGDNKTDAFPG